MGTIQNQAKPYLLELLEGRWPFADAASVRCVAAWATMVTTSIEFADPQTNSSNQEERTKFMADLAPGDNWLVYVGLCHPAMDVGAFWHRGARLPLEGIPEGVAETPNMQTTTFYFGRSFFHTLRVPDELLPNPETYAAEIGIRQIWPIPAAIPGQSLVFTGPGVTRIGGVYWLYLGLNPDPSGGMFIHTGN